MINYKFLCDMPLDPSLNNPTSELRGELAYLSPDFTQIDYSWVYETVDDQGNVTSRARITHPFEQLPMSETERAELVKQLTNNSAEIKQMSELSKEQQKIIEEHHKKFEQDRAAYFAEKGTTYEEFVATHPKS